MWSGQTLSDIHILFCSTFSPSVPRALLGKDGMGILCVAAIDGVGSVTSSLAFEKGHFFQHYCTSAVSSYSQSRRVIYDWTCC